MSFLRTFEDQEVMFSGKLKYFFSTLDRGSHTAWVATILTFSSIRCAIDRNNHRHTGTV